MGDWDGQNRRGEDEPMTHGQHDKICKVGDVKIILTRCGFGLLGSLFLIVGYLVVHGGFARSADLIVIKEGLIRMEGKIETVVMQQTQQGKQLEEMERKITRHVERGSR